MRNLKPRKMSLVIDFSGVIYSAGYTDSSAFKGFKKYCKSVDAPLPRGFYFDSYGNPYEGNYKSNEQFNLIEAMVIEKLSNIDAYSVYDIIEYN